MVDEIAGPSPCPVIEDVPLPDVVAEVLSATGRGEALVSELHQTSPFKHQPVSPIQRVAFAAALLCKGPDMWDAVSESSDSVMARPAWQAAQVFTHSKVKAMKHSIAANEGDTNAFESNIAGKLEWLVRHVHWPENDCVAPLPGSLSRGMSAPSFLRNHKESRQTVDDRMRHLAARIHGLESSTPQRGGGLDLSKAQAQLVNSPIESQGEVTAALVAAASAQRDAAVRRRLGLRLLRLLVKGAVEAEGVEPLLPGLHAALEDTLAQPLACLAHGGVSCKRAMLTELSALLREVHAHCTATSAPIATALSLAMMCVPLSRDELEPLLGSLLSILPTLALDGPSAAAACANTMGIGTTSYCRAHAAQLVLRAYICSQGHTGPALTALLGQLAASLDGMTSLPQVQGPPLPTTPCTGPLEIDWDFGAFGRLCPRSLDMQALSEELKANGSPAAAKSATAFTLKELRRQRATGVLSQTAAAQLFLRLPQGAREEAAVDPVEAVQVLRVDHGGEAPWPYDRRPGSCVAALTLLRPVAELLAMEVPGFVERLLQVVTSRAGQRLPASLAVCLYFKLGLPDEQVSVDSPKLLTLLGEVGRLGGLPASSCRGVLAFAALLARQLTSRANAITTSVLSALQGAVAEAPLAASSIAALDLLGGPASCAACQMQVLNTLFGRSLVVAADAQNVAVLSLDGAADAKAVQWVQWVDLQAPPREAPVVQGIGRASLWGESVVNCLLAAAQRLLARRDRVRERIPPEILRALAAVLPAAPRWDVGIVTEVVQELDSLAAAGVNDLSASPVELLEHRCTLLRLALWQEREKTSAAEKGFLDAASVEEEAALDRAAQVAEVPSVLSVLNHSVAWRGRYKLKRHTNTWYKLKWHMELRLCFQANGALEVSARWPKFPHPSAGRNARWTSDEEGGNGISLEFDVELPGGRREGGRTRDSEVFTWKGRLVQSRGCPHLEGTASGRSSELKYEWYTVPTDPLALLRASDLELFGKQDEGLPRPYSLLSFNTGFIEQKAEHFSSTLGLSSFIKSDGTARDLAMAAVRQLSMYEYINGPREVTKVTKQTQEESWGMHDSLEEEEGGVAGTTSLDERWCSVGEVLGDDGSGARPVRQIVAALEREERQLRHAVLMRLLQVSGVHKGVFSFGGLSDLCVIVIFVSDVWFSKGGVLRLLLLLCVIV